ncbi:hypothetical protein AVEN_51241-1 [Araneus ventricosus]|uniref:Uncharacterized protein n=1 Tax=Araneus ventricosus TaxID=182803 RepID=A0A4Y2LQJ0_ARAVE|nr:hypothetical protein AVEN_51241-1 [Araneus ventricosus]
MECEVPGEAIECTSDIEFLKPLPMARVSAILVRRGPTKFRCCSSVCGMARKFRRIVGKCSDIKGRESMDGDLSTVPTGFCILCIRRGCGASGRIQRGN